MDYHIDRKVVFSTESEFKSLYDWSLHEVDAEGKKVARDQIPWRWDLSFTLSKLLLSDTLTIEPASRIDDTGAPTVAKKQSIRATLLPKDPWQRGLYSETTYSMFGTDRPITDIRLTIVSLDDDEQEEHCTAWGGVSYTAEFDIVEDTIPDCLLFYLYVRPQTFAGYVAMIRAGQIDQAVLRVGRVSGFYSDWSPSISTNKIKVLTSNDEHVVEMLAGSDVAIPRLGTVRRVELDLRRVCNLKTQYHEADDGDDGQADDGSDGESAKPELQSDDGRKAARQLAATNERTVRLLSSLRAAAWTAVVFLFFIMLK